MYPSIVTPNRATAIIPPHTHTQVTVTLQLNQLTSSPLQYRLFMPAWYQWRPSPCCHLATRCPSRPSLHLVQCVIHGPLQGPVTLMVTKRVHGVVVCDKCPGKVTRWVSVGHLTPRPEMSQHVTSLETVTMVTTLDSCLPKTFRWHYIDDNNEYQNILTFYLNM